MLFGYYENEEENDELVIWSEKVSCISYFKNEEGM